jgi:HPt (histidine-containing phosphotransfer) domain-containing protein
VTQRELVPTFAQELPQQVPMLAQALEQQVRESAQELALVLASGLPSVQTHSMCEPKRAQQKKLA